MRKTLFLLFACLAGACLNSALGIFIGGGTAIPLFMDTVFTVTLTLLGGLFWGGLTGALSNLIGNTIQFRGWGVYLFALCNMAVALVTWLFIRFCPRELRFGYKPPPVMRSRRVATVMDRLIVLILLSFCMALVVSILGGVISAFIQLSDPTRLGELNIALTGFSFLGTSNLIILDEILSRIPVNIIDRLIAVFVGYGVAVAINRVQLTKNREQ